jgi:hypothetical protein
MQLYQQQQMHQLLQVPALHLVSCFRSRKPPAAPGKLHCQPCMIRRCHSDVEPCTHKILWIHGAHGHALPASTCACELTIHSTLITGGTLVQPTLACELVVGEV